jgi:hypothetical protein
MTRLTSRTPTVVRSAAAAIAAALTAATAAATITATAADAATAVAIHKVSCNSLTLTVYYNKSGQIDRECFAGLGTIKVTIPDAIRFSTGVNTGSLKASASGVMHTISFQAGWTIALRPPSEITSIDIIHN